MLSFPFCFKLHLLLSDFNWFVEVYMLRKSSLLQHSYMWKSWNSLSKRLPLALPLECYSRFLIHFVWNSIAPTLSLDLGLVCPSQKLLDLHIIWMNLFGGLSTLTPLVSMKLQYVSRLFFPIRGKIRYACPTTLQITKRGYHIRVDGRMRDNINPT